MHFYVTVALSAFLLFLVQPLIAKQILPWFGGSSAVWTTCMLFFQAALLAGYAYADAAPRWLGPRRQARLHIALAAAALLTLPILLPLTIAAGIPTIWFGILVAKLLEIGMITPPVGL
ncbi:MAG: TRAP transporter large permease subunit, partial [Casimicrobiaceae bacterium]